VHILFISDVIDLSFIEWMLQEECFVPCPGRSRGVPHGAIKISSRNAVSVLKSMMSIIHRVNARLNATVAKV